MFFYVFRALLFVMVGWALYRSVEMTTWPLSVFHCVALLLALVVWMGMFLHTGKFVKPQWKIVGKAFFYLAVSNLLIAWVGYYSLIFIIGHPLIGLVFHIKVCRQYDIDWVRCVPREKYIELQEKWARGEFGA